MDLLKKARTPIRSSTTRTITEIEDELSKDLPDQNEIRVKLLKLTEVSTKLSDIDTKLLGKLLENNSTEDEYVAESKAIEDYEDKIRIAKMKAEVALAPTIRQLSPTPSESSLSTAIERRPSKKTYKLPKIEIKKFNGELTEWLSFWSQFEKIHKDNELEDSDKFQYLVQSIVPGTRAKELVDSYPQTGANYPKLIKALQDRFGKEKLLKRVYVRELLKLVIQNNTSTKGQIKISSLFDKIESHLRALESLGITPDQMDVLLFPMVESCLPSEIITAWQRSSNYGRDGSKENPPLKEFDYLMVFLKQEVESEEQRNLAKENFGLTHKDKGGRKEADHNNKKQHKEESDIPTAASLYSGQAVTCIFCEKAHPSSSCIIEMTMEAKKERIQKSRACFQCLKTGHRSKACKSFVKCLICTKKHWAVMCPDLPSHKKTPQNTKQKESPSSEEIKTVSSNLNCTNDVLLRTLLVKIIGRGIEHTARLMFDSGSQRTYIKTASVQLMRYQPVGEVLMQNSLFGNQTTNVRKVKKFNIKLQSLDGKNTRELLAFEQPVLTGGIPRVPHGPWMQELRDKKIWLTDLKSTAPDVEILVGSDIGDRLQTGKIHQLKCGLTAIETVFGWTLSGEIKKDKCDTLVDSSAAALQTDLSLATLTTALHVDTVSYQDLWKLETIGIRDPIEVKTEQQKNDEAKLHFMKTVIQEPDGRYTVSLPWIEGRKCLPTNQFIAERRLITTTRKLKERKQYEVYEEIIKGWAKEGIVELVQETENKTDCHYIPHHPVFKISLTTPVRPVFDASCKGQRSPSLNDCLFKGPNSMELLPSVLLRFREKKIGVLSDIRKAFLMVDVRKEDRDYLRFLWWEDEEKKKIQVFRHNRVMFGLICGPFLLAAVIELHLSKVNEKEKSFADKLMKALYVDNCITSVDTLEDYEAFKEWSTQILAKAQMELRQWESTAVEVSKVSLRPELGCGLDNGSKDYSESQTTKVLGLNWDKDEDVLSLDIKIGALPEKITRRVVLSEIHKIFDPVGVTCPALLIPKLILKRICEGKLDYDEEIPNEAKSEFNNWCDSLPQLAEIRIPRQVVEGARGLEIHTFCDASQVAYAAAVFIRSHHNNEVKVHLVQAKARVAPPRATIPRLELLGCLIAARLTKSVKEALSMEDVTTYYWTDSTTALTWIKRNDQWGTFVGNRVREIIKTTEADSWRHVPGKMNPADLPSRGCSARELLASRWWEGPEWLKDSSESWPHYSEPVDEEEVAREMLKCTKVLTATSTQEHWYEPKDKSWIKNVKIIGWMLRFIKKMKRLSTFSEKYLSIEEMRQAEIKLVKIVQEQSFNDNPKKINKIEVERKEGIMRVKTRLLEKDDTEDFRHPFLLPKDHMLVEELILELHKMHCHAGVQFLMGKLREKYWIPQARRTIRQLLRKCVKCQRFNAKKICLDPASLPESRITTSTPYKTTGVDLAGPIHLKGGSKVWIVLFTCAVYRCLHLDIVTSLSTEAFLGSLQRFINNFGRPNTIYSDNGTNFVGAVNLFKEVDWKKVEKTSHSRQIRWIFNPPTASWWGGWWERLVRSVKDLLRRMIGRAKLSEEDLRNCLSAITATINERPLTTVTEDEEDLIPLTPSMFLRGTCNTEYPEGQMLSERGLQASYKKMQELHEKLQVRFRKEYLAQLVQRAQEKKTPEPKVGDVVLVGADNKKRYEWPMARILELIPGRDGKNRVAKVKTQGGILLRPLQRLYPLEISSPINAPEVPAEIKSIAKASKKKIPVPEPQEEEPKTLTRSGRKVSKPQRYGTWNH